MPHLERSYDFCEGCRGERQETGSWSGRLLLRLLPKSPKLLVQSIQHILSAVLRDISF